ncbi:nucleotide disphospho-sugar-binding domain-containing protein [Chengkuizengella sediminis]|uniref:nucleotide disphospho-sugar-binding domain-containing protein n=1 Tax=Chengkuizengella sediminis TaxID=1885917 RepID=UPI0013896AE2|nr:nucleotide disphospho-sugar-binding domain-containing protein [Chengkuizengella sediminis]NDI35966.1 hypothetical protein [Chengkuizengella sediminis]
MKKIFWGLSGGLGPIVRAVPIAEFFKKKGYEISFNTYGSNEEKFILNLGYHVLSDWDHIPPPVKKYTFLPTPLFYDLNTYYARFGFMDEHFVETLIMERIKLLQEYQPNIVFSDLSLQTAIAAKYLDIPHITINQSCFHPEGLRIRWWENKPENLPDIVHVVNKVLSKLGLDHISCLEELNRGELDLIPSLPSFDPIHADNVLYTGPLVNDFLIEEEVLPQSEFHPDIMIYPGRLKDGAGNSGLFVLYHSLLTLTQSHYKVLVSIAKDETLPKEITNLLTNNIKIVRWFNPSMIKDKKLFIHHGGHGSCMASLKYETPSIIIPTISEREFNARQVKKLGIGEYVVPAYMNEEVMQRVVSKVLLSSSYKNELKKLNENVDYCLDNVLTKILDHLTGRNE